MPRQRLDKYSSGSAASVRKIAVATMSQWQSFVTHGQQNKIQTHCSCLEQRCESWRWTDRDQAEQDLGRFWASGSSLTVGLRPIDARPRMDVV